MPPPTTQLNHPHSCLLSPSLLLKFIPTKPEGSHIKVHPLLDFLHTTTLVLLLCCNIMATDNAICEVSETYNSSSCQEQCDDGETRQQDHSEVARAEYRLLGKALAHRAIFGSSSRRGRARKVRNMNDLKTLPSRLSKVSLADEGQND